MSWALNNITAPDTYGTTAALDGLPPIQWINIDVFNQPIYWQIKQLVGTNLYTEGVWQPEVFMSPGSRSLFRTGIRGFRFRAAIPSAQLPSGGLQAQVTAEAIES